MTRLNTLFAECSALRTAYLVRRAVRVWEAAHAARPQDDVNPQYW